MILTFLAKVRGQRYINWSNLNQVWSNKELHGLGEGFEILVAEDVSAFGGVLLS